MATNMSTSSPKTGRAQQNTEIVELKKAQKMAGKTRSRKQPALAKRAKKRRARKLPVCLTVAEKDRFFKQIKSPRDRAIFGLLFFHGLRASEPGRLVFSDYRAGSSMNLDRIRDRSPARLASCRQPPKCFAAGFANAAIRKGRYSRPGRGGLSRASKFSD
jgi:integrase